MSLELTLHPPTYDAPDVFTDWWSSKLSSHKWTDKDTYTHRNMLLKTHLHFPPTASLIFKYIFDYLKAQILRGIRILVRVSVTTLKLFPTKLWLILSYCKPTGTLFLPIFGPLLGSHIMTTDFDEFLLAEVPGSTGIYFQSLWRKNDDLATMIWAAWWRNW